MVRRRCKATSRRRQARQESAPPLIFFAAVICAVLTWPLPRAVSGFVLVPTSRSTFSLPSLSTGSAVRRLRNPTMSAKSNRSNRLNDDAAPSPDSISVETSVVTLSSGTAAEIMTCVPPPSSSSADTSTKPPLAFVHGSFHGAWCWSIHYMPYFASRGYPCAAISLRGTGGTPAGEGVKKVKIEEHVDDVLAFLELMVNDKQGGLNLGHGKMKPVLIAHSFGGLSAMKLLERQGSACTNESISGVALMCSVPPSGIAKMSLRALRRTPFRAIKIIKGLAMKRSATDPMLCREMFFDDDMAEDTVTEYMGYFKRDSAATIDLGDLSKRLPSACADADGRAPFASPDDNGGRRMPPALVVGGKDDFIVDEEGADQTAAFFGIEGGRATMVDAPHDVMLCTEWRAGAEALGRWLEEDVEVAQ